MTKSLAEAGLTSRPRFVKAPQLEGHAFHIMNAVSNPNGYNGNAEVVFTLRLVVEIEDDVLYDDDGNEVNLCSLSLSSTESRERIADYFRMERHPEPLGPCEFQLIPARRPDMSPFYNIIDRVELVANGIPVSAGNTREVANRADAPKVQRSYADGPQAPLTPAAATASQPSGGSRRRPARSTAGNDDLEDLPF